ncbi:MAG: hypothetical protein WCB96_11385 [Candidatus Aminicenantales bacterium]
MVKNIKLTPQQYEDLLKVVYLGNYLVNNYRPDQPVERFDALESYLFSLAKEFGLPGAMDMDEETGEAYPSEEFSQAEDINLYLDDFIENTFWDELINRLTSRDLFRKYGQQIMDSMPWEELKKKEEPVFQRYTEEIETYGMENLEIVNRRPS